MNKAIRTLKILTSIAALSIIIPGDKCLLSTGILTVSHIFISAILYKLYAVLFIGIVLYIFISGIITSKSKLDNWITVTIILVLNTILAAVIKSILASTEIYTISIAFVFIGLSLSTLFQVIKQLKKEHSKTF